jgi:prevent-host-death family protein
MRTMTYSESRANFAATLSAVVDDREEVIITRAGHESVVIVPLDEYESLKETAYLSRNRRTHADFSVPSTGSKPDAAPNATRTSKA